jgi:hypothetical protein
VAPGARVIDWYNRAAGEVKIRKIIALTAPTYASSGRLISVLKQFRREAGKLSGTPLLVGVAINSSSTASRELLVVVQAGVKTAAQQTVTTNIKMLQAFWEFRFGLP